MKSKKKLIVITLSTIISVLAIAFIGASFYFYNMAVVPGHKTFVSAKKPLSKSDPLYEQKLWYKKQPKQKWTMKSAGANLKLDANYIPASKSTNKTVILLHGYMNNKDGMGEYAAMFHQLGYNALLPDARAHGQSQGKTIGYGWMEKGDVKKWIQKVISKNGKHSQIVLFGVSMGASTAMMTSGLALPNQVKAIVEDCGYTNTKAEIEHEAQELYGMPAFPRFPLIELVSLVTRVRAGYFFGDADAISQLHKNKLPILFIHGSKDTFVPTQMVYENYHATHAPKQLWVVKNATHAKSFATHPKLYQEKVGSFVNKYIK